MQATPHLGFIVAAYSAAVLVVGALTAWVMLDYRVQRRTLIDLDKRGLTRRSAQTPPGETMLKTKEEA
jgi:heme exporter protein D